MRLEGGPRWGGVLGQRCQGGGMEDNEFNNKEGTSAGKCLCYPGMGENTGTKHSEHSELV